MPWTDRQRGNSMVGTLRRVQAPGPEQHGQGSEERLMWQTWMREVAQHKTISKLSGFQTGGREGVAEVNMATNTPFDANSLRRGEILAPGSLLTSFLDSVCGSATGAAPGFSLYMFTPSHQASLSSVPLGTKPPTHEGSWGTINHSNMTVVPTLKNRQIFPGNPGSFVCMLALV